MRKKGMRWSEVGDEKAGRVRVEKENRNNEERRAKKKRENGKN